PGAPGIGPPLYHPAFHEFTGKFITPERSAPTVSTARCTFKAGISSCAGGAVGISALPLTETSVVVASADRLWLPGSAACPNGDMSVAMGTARTSDRSTGAPSRGEKTSVATSIAA